MKILATIVIGFAVLIATLFFLSCSICAVSSGMSGQGRAISVIFALVSLGVMVGGLYLIGAVNKGDDKREE